MGNTLKTFFPELAMSWNPRDTVNLRLEFVFGSPCKKGAHRRELCQRYGISAKTGYK